MTACSGSCPRLFAAGTGIVSGAASRTAGVVSHRLAAWCLSVILLSVLV
jgi:hypothetical protein